MVSSILNMGLRSQVWPALQDFFAGASFLPVPVLGSALSPDFDVLAFFGLSIRSLPI
jgi:hypothetical protein